VKPTGAKKQRQNKGEKEGKKGIAIKNKQKKGKRPMEKWNATEILSTKKSFQTKAQTIIYQLKTCNHFIALSRSLLYIQIVHKNLIVTFVMSMW
jgi:hypothetical protein